MLATTVDFPVFDIDVSVDVDEIVASRIHDVGLSVMRSEATQRLQQRKAELVDLINEDYAAFIGISTALKDYKPLPPENLTVTDGDFVGAVRSVLMNTRSELQEMAIAVESLLTQRSELRDLKLVERVASEFNQLLFLVSSAEKTVVAHGESSDALKSLSWRIDRIKSALTSVMRHTLESALSAVADSNSPEAEASLMQCLRTYLLIDRARDAGSELKQMVLKPIENIASSSSNQSLSTFFAKILSFLDEKVQRTVVISRRVFGNTSNASNEFDSYDFLADEVLSVVWASVGKFFNGCWNAGSPDVFQQVYFKIRAKELVGSFDSVFGDNIREVAVSENPGSAGGFHLMQTSRLLQVLETMWKSDGVFVPALSAQFWKFSLQCLNRYSHWVKTLLVSVQVSLKEIGELPKERTVAPAAVPGTPPPNPSLPQNIQEDSILFAIGAILADNVAVKFALQSLFDGSIAEKLPLGFTDLGKLKEHFLRFPHDQEGAVVSEYQNEISVVVQRTGFSSNIPSSASLYVSKILEPAKEFFGKLSEVQSRLVTHEAVSAAIDMSVGTWKVAVCDGVIGRFHAVAGQQLEDLTKLDKYSRSRRKTQTQAAEGGAAASAFDKIKQQLRMDVEQFEREVRALAGSDAPVPPAFAALRALV
ncbi:Conserved oligomeric Golgi complex subunit 2 [Entophlyctis sp. JEL0112]|nr:Conserved oligomeric Golgi complex subunit 2 [Entophlyctis sp. JEL0112]